MAQGSRRHQAALESGSGGTTGSSPAGRFDASPVVGFVPVDRLAQIRPTQVTVLPSADLTAPSAYG